MSITSIKYSFFVLAIFLVACANAFVVAPIFSASSQQCRQINESHLNCTDGTQINFGFSVSAPYEPIYGNFTVQTINAQVATNPVSITGGACIVSYSTTVSCFSKINPIPIFAANGTINRTITFKLISSNYPQISYLIPVNLIITHYASGDNQVFLNIYTDANSSYTNDSTTYQNFCKNYQICSTSIADNLSVISRLIKISAIQINVYHTQEALGNASTANQLITNLQLTKFSNYVNNSNDIIFVINQTNVVKANSLQMYTANRPKLSACTFSNGTTYSKSINGSITRLLSYKQANNLTAADAMLAVADDQNKNESSLISTCNNKVAVVAALSGPLPFGPRLAVSIIIALVVTLIVYLIIQNRENASVQESYGTDRSTKVEQPTMIEVATSEPQTPEVPVPEQVPIAAAPVEESAAPTPEPTQAAQPPTKQTKLLAKKAAKQKPEQKKDSIVEEIKETEERDIKKMEEDMQSLESTFDNWLNEALPKGSPEDDTEVQADPDSEKKGSQ